MGIILPITSPSHTHNSLFHRVLHAWSIGTVIADRYRKDSGIAMHPATSMYRRPVFEKRSDAVYVINHNDLLTTKGRAGYFMSLNSTTDDRDMKMVASEIVQYLRQRQQVADTAEGIVNWWLMRQRLLEERRKVEQALEYLCEQGFIQKRLLQDGSVLYTASNNIVQA